MSGTDPRPRRYPVFVVGAFRFPHGDASAQRLLTLAQACAAAGRPALVVNDTATHAPEGYAPGMVASVDGVDYVCLPGPTGGKLRRFLHRASRPLRLATVVRRHRESTGVPVVSVASGLCSLGLLVVLRRFVGAKVVADVVERHDAAQFPRGPLDPYFVRHRWTSFLARHLADGVIVISRTLASRNTRSARDPMLLPALVDLTGYGPPGTPEGTRLDLVYVGNPRGKDRLGVLFDAVTQLEPTERARVRVTVAGADVEALRRNPDVGPARVAALGEGLHALGYVDRSVVLELLSASDFSVLLRPPGGYADAGFPTKVPESLAAGCPVLCNLTTDLGEYLTDGDNAMICPTTPGPDGVSVPDLAATLRRALALTVEDRTSMKRAARASAESFSAQSWGAGVATYLDTLR